MVEQHGLTERDMPPSKTIPILRKTGFRFIRLHPRLSIQLTPRAGGGRKERIVRKALGNYLADVSKAAFAAIRRRSSGFVVATK
jgi:hypothetical protein